MVNLSQYRPLKQLLLDGASHTGGALRCAPSELNGAEEIHRRPQLLQTNAGVTAFEQSQIT